MGQIKFINFGGEITNLKHVICFYKSVGRNERYGQYAITLVREGCDNVYQWFDTEEARNTFFDEISTKLCE